MTEEMSAPSRAAPRATKIVCTIGPASRDEATLDRLIAAGMNVARLNMSHSDRDSAGETFDRIRRAAAARGLHVAILVDLQGPKIRTGPLAGGGPVTLAPGAPFTITTAAVPGSAEIVSTSYRDLPRDVRPGDRVLLSDGLIELRAERVTATEVECRVVEGGVLRERQGINLPGVEVHTPALTPKDEDDLRWAVARGADYIAVSFVQRPEDVLAARQAIAALESDIPVVAKLEKPRALERLNAILAVTDAVMVARGDMGVELPPEQVPIWQKRIIAAANAALVPVITATQMLESMVHEPRPTRAEVTDVATAIWDGTDAVMLSAETSIGAYPVESVTMMDRICRATEGDGASQRPTMDARRASTYADAISLAAYHIAGASPAVTAIAAFTRDGATARLISKQRPAAPILGLCAGDRVARRLALYHGVVPIPVELVDEVEGLVRVAETEGARAGVLATGDTVLITGHLPLEAPGSTNFLLLHRAGDAVTSPESRVQSPESGV